MVTQAPPVAGADVAQQQPTQPVQQPDTSLQTPPLAPVGGVAAGPAAPTAPAPVPEAPQALQYQPSPEQQFHRVSLDYQRAKLQLQTQHQAHVTQLLEYGLTEEQAKQAAGKWLTDQEAGLEAVHIARAQQVVALTFSQRYHVPVQELVDYPDVVTMERGAKQLQRIQALGSENAQLKAEIDKLRKAQVPAQQFAAPNGAPVMGAATPDNIDALWVQFDRQHPNQANPFDRQYREYLNR